MVNKIIAFFVEGPTEVEFYKALVNYAREENQGKLDCSFAWVNMKGIGNYKSSAISKFLELKRKNPNSEIHVYLCIDTDAFESVNKPFDKDNVKKALEN